MASYVGPSLTELPGWRIGLLFLFFALVAFFYSRGVKALDRHFKRHGKRGLRKVLKALQNELLILGLLSLLLVAFEKYLLLVCIPCDGGHCYWDVEGPEADPSDVEVVEGTCSDGSEPVWSPNAIIQAHILLFVIAVVHILYTTAVMLLCLWKVGRWKPYEERSRGEMQPIRYRALPVPGGNPVAHFFRCLLSMFTESVNADVYCGLRRLFVERMDLDDDFDFHGFLVESMEEEMARIISVDFVLWAVVILWIMLPPETWVMVWMAGLATLALLVVGVKLESIINQLTVSAYQRYGEQESSHTGPREGHFHAFGESLRRLSPFSHGWGKAGGGETGAAPGPCQLQQGGCQGAGCGGAGAGALADLEAAESPRCLPPPPPSLPGAAADAGGRGEQHRAVEQQAQRGEQQQPQQGEQVFTRARVPPAVHPGGPRGRGATGDSAMEATHAGEVPFLAVGLPSEDGLVLGASASAGVPPGNVPRPSAQQRAVELPGGSLPQQAQQRLDGAEEGGVSRPPSEEQPCPNGHSLENGWTRGSTSSDSASDGMQQGEQQQRQQGSADPPGMYRRSLAPLLRWSVVQQGAAWCSACLRRLLEWVQHEWWDPAATPGGRDGELDAASLFWLGRPRLLLRIVQVVYFENSLALASFLFSLWQGLGLDWGRGQRSQWAIIAPLLALDISLLVFSALFVMPVYAMTTAAGSHCPESVIKHALENPKLMQTARALQRLSMDPAIQLPCGDAGLGEQELPPLQGQPQEQQQGLSLEPWEFAPGLPPPAPPPQPPPGPDGATAAPAAAAAAAAAGHSVPGRPSLARTSASAYAAVGPQSLARTSAAGPPVLGRPSLARASLGSAGGGGGRLAGLLGEQAASLAGGVEDLLMGAGEAHHDEDHKAVSRLLDAMLARQFRKRLQRASMGPPGPLDSPTAAQQQQQQQEGGAAQGWFPEYESRSLPSNHALHWMQGRQEASFSVPSTLHANPLRGAQRPSLAEVQALFRQGAGASLQAPQSAAAPVGAVGAGPSADAVQPLRRELSLT